jgi:hypothetical protein
MAGYRGHIVGGAVLGAGYAGALMIVLGLPLAIQGAGILPSGWERIAAMLVLAMLFALWPDVDTNSKGQDIFYGGVFVLDIVLIFGQHLEAAAYLGLLALLPIVGRHRGWTHTYAAMALVPLPILLVPYLHNTGHWQSALMYYGAAVAGYFSHLLLDGLVVRWFRIRSHGFGD